MTNLTIKVSENFAQSQIDWQVIQNELETTYGTQIFASLVGSELLKHSKSIRFLDYTKKTSEVFYDFDNNKPFIKDYNSGNCYFAVTAYAKAYNLSFGQATKELAIKYSLYSENNFKSKIKEVFKPKVKITPKEQKAGVNFAKNIKFAPFTNEHYTFFECIGISRELLGTQKISAISSFELENTETKKVITIKTDFAFAFEVEPSIYQIYQPNNEKYKWSFIYENNAIKTKDIYYCLDFLPKEKCKVFLVEGYKDALAFNANFNHMNLYAVGLYNCSNDISSLFELDIIKNKELILLLDNDKPGKTANLEKSKKHKINFLEYPKELSTCKDIAVLCKGIKANEIQKDIVSNWLNTDFKPKTKENAKESPENAQKYKFSERVQRTKDYFKKIGIYENPISEIVYYKDKKFNKKMQNSIFLHCKNEFGINAEEFFALVKSNDLQKKDSLTDFISKYNETKKEFPGTIQKVFECLQLTKDENSEPLFSIFQKFLVGIFKKVFAKTSDDKNDLFLLLVGNNYLGKTRFLNRIFSQFSEISNISNDTKELKSDNVIRQSVNNIVLIFDELPSNFFDKQNENNFKSILSNNTKNIVQKFENIGTNLQSISSFVGTTNYKHIINSEFNRRIIPIEIQSVNFESLDKINIFEFWCEVYSLYLNNFQNYLNELEINFVKNVLSVEHKEVPFLHSLILDKISIAKKDSPTKIIMNATEIKAYLDIKESDNKIGFALKELGFEKHKNQYLTSTNKRVSSAYFVEKIG